MADHSEFIKRSKERARNAQENLRSAEEAAEAGHWDDALRFAKMIPSSWNVFGNFPQFGIPPDQINKVMDAVPKDDMPNFLFELSGNLHPDTDMKTLTRILSSAGEDHYVESNIKRHKNWGILPEHKGLHAASEFWRSYEKKVRPNHFAVIKSMFSGKPEDVKDHRGNAANSHGDHFITNGGIMVAGGAPGFDFENNAIKVHDVIPHLGDYAKSVQSKIMEDPSINKRYFNGKPYIQLHRGLGGDYADAVRNKVEFNKKTNQAKQKNFILPTAHLSSWTTDQDMARSFARSRGEHLGSKGSGIVITAWHPVESVLHSGFHDAVIGQEHAHPQESEIVVGHPQGKMKVNSKNIEFAGEFEDDQFTLPELVKSYPLLGGKEELSKGQNGDWKKEGYQVSGSGKPNEYGFFSITAHHPKYGQVGDAAFMHDGNIIRPATEDEIEENGGAGGTNVLKPHRRKGLASAMYAHAEKMTGKKVIPSSSSEQTDDARGLWQNPNRPFGKSDLLPGGKGDKAKISDFDPKEFAMGMKVESEHTSNSKVASEVARDHLTENPKYYSKLKTSGLADELEKSQNDIAETAEFWQQHGDLGDRENLHNLMMRPENKEHRKNMINALAEDKTIKSQIVGGKRYFLLHRGIGSGEKNHYRQDYQSGSWTTNKDVAKNFAESYRDGNSKPIVLTRWHPEDNISFSMEHGHVVGANTHSGESEVISDHPGHKSLPKPMTQEQLNSMYPPKDPRRLGKNALEKGLKGDWKKEGYQVWASHDPIFDDDGEEMDEDPNHFTVYAQHPTHGDVGKAHFRIDGNGNLFPHEQDGNNAVEVDPAHQRKGIAGAMYKEAEHHAKKILSPSSWQTDAGKALWNQPNRPFGKSRNLFKALECLDAGESLRRSDNSLKFSEKEPISVSGGNKNAGFGIFTALRRAKKAGFADPQPQGGRRGGGQVNRFIRENLRLEKTYFAGGSLRPEASDKDGMNHPDKPYIKGTTSNGDPAWFHNHELQMAHEEYLGHAIDSYNSKNNPSAETKQRILNLSKLISSDPDRHAIPTESREGQKLRLRHLTAALSGVDGYSVKDSGGGIKITAPRHSSKQSSRNEIHSWSFDGNRLKFNGIERPESKPYEYTSQQAPSAPKIKEAPAPDKSVPVAPGIRKRVGGLKKSWTSIPHVASVAVMSSKGLLMGRRNDNGKWTMAGGGMNPGETPIDAAKRELFEEAGVKAHSLQYLGSKMVVCPDGVKRVIHSFLTYGERKTDSSGDPDAEVKNWVWVDTSKGLPKEIISNLHSPRNVTLAFLGLQK